MDDKLTPEQEEIWLATQEFYVALDKLVRGIQLYQGKGGLVERLLAELMKRCDKMLQRGDSTVKISPIGPICFDKPIFEDGKVAKYIFQMYRDGIRELTFKAGIGPDEIKTFSDICNEDVAAMDDDIVTLMWKAGFECIQYYAVDSLGEQAGEESLEDSELLGEGDILGADGNEEAQFSASDMRLLRSKDSVNWVQMCTAPLRAGSDFQEVIQQVQAKWPQEQDFGRFLAIVLKLTRSQNRDVSLVLDLFKSMANNGRVESVVGLLEGLHVLASNDVTEANQLLRSILSEEQIAGLKDFFEHHYVALQDVMIHLVALDNFQADGLIHLLQLLPVGDARSSLQEILLHSSVDMTQFYVQGLSSEDEAIVLESIASLSKVQSEGALRALYGCLGHSLSTIRQAALQGVNGQYLPGEAKQIGKVLKDPSEENRMLALEICQSVVDRELGGILIGIMQEVSFGRRSMTEQHLFFQLLSSYPTPTVFQYLSEILKDKNIVRSKTVTTRQLWCVDVFEAIGTDDAKSILQGLKGNWFLPTDVKSRIKEVI
jgi:hypothetical protein